MVKSKAKFVKASDFFMDQFRASICFLLSSSWLIIASPSADLKLPMNLRTNFESADGLGRHQFAKKKYLLKKNF